MDGKKHNYCLNRCSTCAFCENICLKMKTSVFLKKKKKKINHAMGV